MVDLPLPVDGTTATIGRGDACDIVLEHDQVPTEAATLVAENGEWTIVDSGTFNGVFVNGVRVASRRLADGDVIRINPARMRFIEPGTVLVELIPARGLHLEVVDVVQCSGARRLVDQASFTALPNELVAIVGGSGCGKSSILRSLTGFREPDGGAVLINGEYLYNSLPVFRSMIGFVPQHTSLPGGLTVHQTMQYAARLRLPRGVPREERERRIHEALDDVELEHRIDSRIRTLSGGEQRRLSIALELVQRPRMLILDEPTSGLDPNLDRHIMRLFRQIADAGCTVIVVTHTPAQLKLCDRVVFFADGGRVAFEGRPEEMERSFAANDEIDCYAIASNNPEFAISRHVESRIGAVPPVPSRRTSVRDLQVERASFITQLAVLSRRNTAILLSDRKNLLLLLAQAPIIGLLVALVSAPGAFEDTTVIAQKSIQAAFAIVLSITWLGLINAAREIVRDRGMLMRERMAGVGTAPFILAKILPQAVLLLVQTFVLLWIVAQRTGIPKSGIIMAPALEIGLSTFLAGSAAMAVGLLFSAVVRNEDRAISVVPYALMPQLLFAGVAFSIPAALDWVMSSQSSYWATSAISVTVDACSHPYVGGPTCQAALRVAPQATASTLMTAWAILGLLTGAALVLTGIAVMLTDRAAGSRGRSTGRASSASDRSAMDEPDVERAEDGTQEVA